MVSEYSNILYLSEQGDAAFANGRDREGEERHPALRCNARRQIEQIDAKEIAGAGRDRACGVRGHFADVEHDGEGICEIVVASDVWHTGQGLL